jgi:hypothetical protein
MDPLLGEGVAISSVMVRRVLGTLVGGEKLANAVSAGNNGRHLTTETSKAGPLSL